MPFYKIKVWIPVEVEPDEDTIYDSVKEAFEEKAGLDEMQPENFHGVVECDEDGNEVEQADQVEPPAQT